MNLSIRPLLALLAAGGATATALAGPLNPKYLPADAKWVIHLDVESFLRSQVGRTLAKEVLDPPLSEAGGELEAELGVDYDWHDLRGLTLYGRDYAAPRRAKGVLLIDGKLDLKAGLEAALKKQESAGVAKDGPVELLETGKRALYSISDRAFVALSGRKPTVVGQSKEQVEAARKVLLGEAANLTKAPRGGLELPRKDRSFILIAAARGFADQAPLPPRARVLKMADGLQATLQESGTDLVLDLTLLTKNADVSEQVVSVIQGLKAMVGLSQPDNPDLQALARGLSVRSSDKRVSITLKLRSKLITDRIVEKARENKH